MIFFTHDFETIDIQVLRLCHEVKDLPNFGRTYLASVRRGFMIDRGLDSTVVASNKRWLYL